MHELNELDHQLTLAINGSDSLFWDNLMYTVTNTFSWTLVIITLLIIIFKNNTWKEAVMVYVTIALLIFVADRICSGIVKPMVERWRPTQDPQLMYLVDVVRNYRGGRFGFFSGHACNTMCMAVFLHLHPSLSRSPLSGRCLCRLPCRRLPRHPLLLAHGALCPSPPWQESPHLRTIHLHRLHEERHGHLHDHHLLQLHLRPHLLPYIGNRVEHHTHTTTPLNHHLLLPCSVICLCPAV